MSSMGLRFQHKLLHRQDFSKQTLIKRTRSIFSRNDENVLTDFSLRCPNTKEPFPAPYACFITTYHFPFTTTSVGGHVCRVKAEGNIMSLVESDYIRYLKRGHGIIPCHVVFDLIADISQLGHRLLELFYPSQKESTLRLERF